MAKAAEELGRVTQKQVLSIPRLLVKQTDSSTDATSDALQTLDDPVTPKTPADEGKEYFLSERCADERQIRVYELRLDPDGGPNKERSVSAYGVNLIRCSQVES